MTSARAAHAINRFGLGPRPGETEAASADPENWVASQLDKKAMPPEVASFGTDGQAEQTYLLRNMARRKDAKTDNPMAQKDAQQRIRGLYVEQMGKRFLAACNTQTPFLERLVLFWSNHFTISTQKNIITPLVNAYEVEAIRPYVTGRFSDMLKAVVSHPGMLVYLDNFRSVGPNSPRGRRSKSDINENLGREILELHTLGVNGGYNQNDVISLAKIITGWTLAREQGGPAARFEFMPAMHEPGPKTLLGKSFAEDGVREGAAALDYLAAHSATAKHIANKLARHFIADEPPQAAVDALAQSFVRSGGDLKAVYRTLIDLPQAWENPLTKFKTPYEYAVSAIRITGIKPNPKQAVNGLDGLNFRPFSAPSPAGLPDTEKQWAGSDAIMKRIEWSQALSRRLPVRVNPLQIATSAYGALLRSETQFIINGAASGQDGFAFLLASPEFMRR